MNKTITRLIAICLALFSTFNIARADFADDINEAAHPFGRQVIYEMNVGSFTENGTFAAAKDRLASLKKTGIDIVWLMPIYPRGGGINSPYAATDFKAVNPSYGTLADLKEFVSEAHRLGMKVWLDWVPNHTATNAVWVTTHPEYYTVSNGQMVHPNNYNDVYELNYNNSGLVDAMNDCLKYWINEADVDGFRCDYVSSPTIPGSYWESTIKMLRTLKPSIVMLAEADINNTAKLNSVGFDYDYSWDFQERLESFGGGTVAATVKNAVNVRLLKNVDEQSYTHMVYLTNHDANWNNNKKTLTQKYVLNRYPLTVLEFTIWGMPLIYNGQEIGGNQALNYFEDTKIDWTNVDTKMQNTIRCLSALKHSQDALKDGPGADNAPVNWLETNDSQVLAYSRTKGDNEVVVVLNFGTGSKSVTLNGLNGSYSQWLNSSTIENGIERTEVSANGGLTVNLEGKGYAVFVKNETTGVSMVSIKSDKEGTNLSNFTYNLAGQRTDGKVQHGIIIRKGKKYILR